MSIDLLEQLDSRFARAMRDAFGDAIPDNAPTLISPSRNPEFGDFQCNAAMGLAKRMGEKPRDVATKIIEHLDLSGIEIGRASCRERV